MVQKEYDKLIKSNSIKKLLESIKEDGNSATYLLAMSEIMRNLKRLWIKLCRKTGPSMFLSMAPEWKEAGF